MWLKASTARPTSSRGGAPGCPPVSSLRDQSPAAKSVSAAVSCWIGRLTPWAMNTSGSSDTSHAAPSSTSSVSVNPRRRSRVSISFDEPARLSKLGGQLLHADAAQVTAEDLDAAPVSGTVGSPHVVHTLAAGPRHAKALRLTALPERADGLWPRGRVRRRVHRRPCPACERVLLQRVAFPLIEQLRGSLERARESVEFARCRIPQAAVEERRRDPHGGAERQQG